MPRKFIPLIAISLILMSLEGAFLNISAFKIENRDKDTIFNEETLNIEAKDKTSHKDHKDKDKEKLKDEKSSEDKFLDLETGFTDDDDLERFGGLEFNFKKSKHLRTFRNFDLNSADKQALKSVKANKNAITSGKGIWVNIWNYPKNVDAFIDRLTDYHIDTVYLQVNRSTTEVFRHQIQIDEILKACKKADIKIIGWSYAYLHDVKADADKFIKPALYVSPEGYSFDAMAADIEENYKVESVKRYTELIKAAVPEDYPLIAIVFSPQIKPVYPWEYIAGNWDILMPMIYWHGIKQRDSQRVATFVADSIHNLRKYTKKDDLNIHMITDGERTTPSEVAISLEVAQKLKVNSGISVYPEHLVPNSVLEVIKEFKA